MPKTIIAYGKKFTVPDSATHEQIQAIVSRYAPKPEVAQVLAGTTPDEPRDESSFFDSVGDFSKGIDKGLLTVIDRGANHIRSGTSWLGEKLGLDDGLYTPSRLADEIEDKDTIAFSAGEITGELIPAFAGGLGASRLAAPAIAKGVGWVANPTARKLATWGADGLVSSVGAQVASAKAPDAGQTATDVAINVGANMLLPKVGGLIKTVLRGKQEGELMQAAAITGVTPSRGMTTGSKSTQFLEKHLESVFGAGGVFQRFNDKNQAALNQFADALRRGMGGGGASNEVGDALKQAYDDLIAKGTAESDRYFTEAIQRAGNHRIGLALTRRELNNINAIARNNPAIAEVIQSPQFKQLSRAITGGKGLDLQGAIRLKGAISSMIEGTGAGTKATDVRDLTRLYKALNDDVSQSLDLNAPFGAFGAWDAGNRVYSAMQRTQDEMSKIFDGAGGDTLYARIFGKPSDALTITNPDRVRAILSVLPEETQNVVRSEILWRAGREAAGQAGNEGRQFSAAAFLTNWTKLKDNGLSDVLSGAHKADIDALALISSRLKDTGRAANFSNTANHLTVANGLQLVAATATGNVAAAIPFIMANVSARFLTNPEAAKTLWRIASGMQTESQLAESLFRLAVIATDDRELQPDVELITEALTGERGESNTNP